MEFFNTFYLTVLTLLSLVLIGTFYRMFDAIPLDAITPTMKNMYVGTSIILIMLIANLSVMIYVNNRIEGGLLQFLFVFICMTILLIFATRIKAERKQDVAEKESNAFVGTCAVGMGLMAVLLIIKYFELSSQKHLSFTETLWNQGKTVMLNEKAKVNSPVVEPLENLVPNDWPTSPVQPDPLMKNPPPLPPRKNQLANSDVSDDKKEEIRESLAPQYPAPPVPVEEPHFEESVEEPQSVRRSVHPLLVNSNIPNAPPLAPSIPLAPPPIRANFRFF